MKSLILGCFISLSASLAQACALCDLPVFAVTNVAPYDVLNIRAAPAPQAAKLGSIPSQAEGILHTGGVHTEGVSEWYEIIYQDTTGWVNARFLIDTGRLNGEPVDKDVDAHPHLDASVAWYRVAVEDWDQLNARTGPGADYAIVERLAPDTVVADAGADHWIDETRWTLIQFDGGSGWVNAAYLRVY